MPEHEVDIEQLLVEEYARLQQSKPNGAAKGLAPLKAMEALKTERRFFNFIDSGGDLSKLRAINGLAEVPPDFDYRWDANRNLAPIRVDDRRWFH